VFQVLTGGDVSYDENGSRDELTTQYRAGGRLLYQWGEGVLWRVGATVQTDLNINSRNGLAVALNLQVGITPLRAPPLESKSNAPSFYQEFAEVRDRSIRIYLGEALLSFPTGSERLGTKARESLSLIVPVLMRNEKNWSKIRIEGHTDSRDQNHQNQKLSERRAKAVSNEFIALGFLADRITVLGFGATKPIDPASNEEAYLLNRRVEIWVDDLNEDQIQSLMTELRQIK
jgi:outer membrane protein OmpA-like peptidoglycan-associated protein